VLAESGDLIGISLWFRDITERVKLAKTVERRQRLNVLGSLAGAVAHHYNNLLCNIATSIDYAMNLNTPGAIQRALQRTGDAVTRAGEINQQLLAFARADHRARTFSDLTETVLYYFDEHEEQITARNIKLDLTWSPLPICAVPRDPFIIIIENLVRNACEAMPEGGTLTVSLTRHDERHAALSITDTGSGIESDALEHLFEPFYSTKGVLARGTSSNAGMGLAVVHGFISEMGGFVTAGNQPTGGAKFEIVLPLQDHSLAQ
jgi:two-component system cell cycle sensor histidine kinase/response regulator CckA